MILKNFYEFEKNKLIVENSVDKKIKFFFPNTFISTEIPNRGDLLSNYSENDLVDIKKYLNKDSLKKASSFLRFYINELDKKKEIEFSEDDITKSLNVLNKFGMKSNMSKPFNGTLYISKFEKFDIYKYNAYFSTSYYIDGDVDELVKYIKSTKIIEDIIKEYTRKYDDVVKMVKDEQNYISLKELKDSVEDSELSYIWSIEDLAKDKGCYDVDFVIEGTDLHKFLGSKFIENGYIVTTPEIGGYKFMVSKGYDAHIIARL